MAAKTSDSTRADKIRKIRKTRDETIGENTAKILSRFAGKRGEDGNLWTVLLVTQMLPQLPIDGSRIMERIEELRDSVE